MAEKYLTLDLDDERMSNIAEILSNKTCKKILNWLSENEGSVSKVSENLKIPLNTVDYNIKKLLKAG